MRVLLQEQLMNARLAWVVAHERWYQPQWNSVLFSDESRFTLSYADGRQRILRRDGDCYAAVEVALSWYGQG